LRFTCQRGCVNCCNQQGFVYLTEDDVRRAAKFVGLRKPVFEAKFIYRTLHQLLFRKARDKQCPFLLDHGCSIHPAKPTQCRMFPFWPEIVEDRDEWKRTAKFCPGIGKGPLIQIGTAMELADQQRRAYPEMYQ